MSIVDLGNRITTDWEEYNKFVKSNDSLIYVDGRIILKDVGPASINITVGSQWRDITKNKSYQIGEDGIKVQSGKCILIETEQRIALPYNIFGVVYGTGKNIFRGGFVSTGKINPGYNGNLKIGYYNGNSKTICFKKGDLLACCSFYNMETTTKNALENYINTSEPEILEPNVKSRVWAFITKNWYAILSLIISIVALFYSIL